MVSETLLYLVYPEQHEHLMMTIATTDIHKADSLARSNKDIVSILDKGYTLKFINLNLLLNRQGYELEISRISRYH